MFSLGPFALAAPAALFGLLALPVIWLLLRATPPAPKRLAFPPLRLLRGLDPEEETPDRTPWWLTLLRLVIVTAAILGLARPILFPVASPAGEGPLVLVIDDGWASAPNWTRMVRTAQGRLDAARQDGRRAAVVFTTRGRATGDIVLVDPADAARVLAAREPQPWAPDRAYALERLAEARASGRLPANANVVWVADGLDHGAAIDFARGLGDGLALAPDAVGLPLALRPLEVAPNGFSATVVRADGLGQRDGAIVALDAGGGVLARAPFHFEDGVREAVAEANLPLELRNRAVAARVEGAPSAGGAQVLDDGWRRPLIGLVTNTAEEDRQPLLTDLHYLTQALAPSAETRRGDLGELLELSPGAIVLSDTGRIVGPDVEELARFVADGGLLVRFAGPHLAARADDFSPVTLRAGGRALGGALAWDEPQTLATFEDDSPFFGLTVSEEVTVSRQVLAEPAPDLSDKTWARLSDGTPLVTAVRRGRGWVVLFHVTASPEWSNLPLSGLFPEMLARVAAYSNAGGPPRDQRAEGPWRLETALSAAARLQTPREEASIDAASFAATAPSFEAPPGRYRRGSTGAALNIMTAETTLRPLPALPDGLVLETDAGPAPRHLGGSLLSLALGLLILDAMAVGALSGAWRSLARRFAPAAAAVLAVLFIAPEAPAQELDETFALEALSELRLAYVLTGDAHIDAMSRAGLIGLSDQLRRRTSVEPGDPIAVDIENTAIELLPMLYWPVTPDTPAPSPEAAARLNLFMRTGGVIVLDTRDALEASLDRGPHPGLERLANAIDIPPLREPEADHVLTRAFFLLREFPGRWAGEPVWVEADAVGTARDGVSSVIVGSADWAGAWAVDDDGNPLAAVSPSGEYQREIAYRFGVNLVMYVLTGNYKADQVHIPAILERLGQ